MGKISFKKTVTEIEGYIAKLHKKRTAAEINDQFHIIRKTIAESTNSNVYNRLMDKIHMEYDMIYAERVLNYDLLGGQTVTETLSKIRKAQANA